NKGIEITPHPISRIGLEVAPFVMIGETAGGNDCPGRNSTQLNHFGTGQGLVDRRELVVLVFTHGKFSVSCDQRASVQPQRKSRTQRPKSSRKRPIWCIFSCRMVTIPMSPFESRRQ